MVHSPNWDLISASLPPVEYNPSHKLKSQMFQDTRVDTKRKQKETALNPTDTLFNFLCCATIDANALLTSIKMGKLNYVLQKRWLIEKKIPIVPFKDMKDTFEKAPCPLTHRHYQLPIGDFLLLSPGNKILCLISKKHEWL